MLPIEKFEKVASEKKVKMTDINIKIPTETFLEIFSYLNGTMLGKCRRVNKHWKAIIDDSDLLWHGVCKREFRCSSKVARQKASRVFKWYHIYKNLRMWSKITEYECKVRSFYEFSLNNINHALEIHDSVLPLKDAQGIVLYDMSTLKYIPVAIPEKNCYKFANNNVATVLLLKSSLILARTHCDSNSETYFEANDFLLNNQYLLYHYNRKIYKCDITQRELIPELLLKSEFDIKEMHYENHELTLFTDCGKIVISKGDREEVQSINCPVEWIKQIRYIKAIDKNNFVCFSRNLFQIQTDKSQHLYIDFPSISALFFYGDDIVLIGTKAGEILLYRLSSQIKAKTPVFENLVKLPEGKFAVHLDVTERKTGPVIIVGTFFELFLIEVNFFPHEEPVKATFGQDKIAMFKRLLKIRDKFMNYFDNAPSGTHIQC